MARPDVIVWNSISPRAAFAWQVPHWLGLTLRGAYSRGYEPLAGRYLDFANANSLGAGAYRWIASDPNQPFHPSQAGELLYRFGGPYSTVSPVIRRAYHDEFDVGAGIHPTERTTASIYLFRRDGKRRIAAINSGLPDSAFAPVSIADPGPDGVPGTFDDQLVTVYAQNPATLGRDLYLLTNPAGPRMLKTGLVAEAGTELRGVTLHASFAAEKSYGPTNPGDAVYENDPGVVGGLFGDPNTVVHAAGRSFMDRAYVGKFQVVYRLPPVLGGIEAAGTVDYLDGLVFARQLLVTGLPQGPFVVAATVRGSPEGGNRAEHATVGNVRLSREFALSHGRMTVWADVLNVTNAGHSVQQDNRSGPSFNLRPPLAIQPPRFARFGFRFSL
jgi:hypothetical protein